MPVGCHRTGLRLCGRLPPRSDRANIHGVARSEENIAATAGHEQGGINKPLHLVDGHGRYVVRLNDCPAHTHGNASARHIGSLDVQQLHGAADLFAQGLDLLRVVPGDQHGEFVIDIARDGGPLIRDRVLNRSGDIL